MEQEQHLREALREGLDSNNVAEQHNILCVTGSGRPPESENQVIGRTKAIVEAISENPEP